MTCRECNEFLSDYRSGELTPKERARFEAHLAWCSSCVIFLSSYEEAIRLAKSAWENPVGVLPAEAPEELVQAILAAHGSG